MKKLSGIYDLNAGTFASSSSGVAACKDGALEMEIFGSVYTASGRNNAPEIASLFREYGCGITEHLSGFYILLICDGEKLSVFHDRATSPVAFYYTQSGSKVFFSTSLRDLLNESGIERALNENTIEEFIVNGYIYGDETLLRDVFEIKAYHCLAISRAGIEQTPVRYPLTPMTKGEALDRFRETLDSAIENVISDIDSVSFPLSSGYDSNYIAYVSTEKAGKTATAFSVGGSSGKNELPLVEKNVRYYKNLTLKSALTDGGSLRNLPDIVRRLEGNVYESGIFLQYELMKLVSESGKKSLVCGECADQIMNLHYHDKDRIYPARGELPEYYEFSEYPYIFSSYLILKKSGILANSFDIEARYPYLDERLISVCKPLGCISMKDKRVHVANCRECLPPEVVANMSKIGGSTDCHSLFTGKKEIKEFFALIEGSSFFKRYGGIIEKHDPLASERQTGVTLLKTKIRNIILTLLHMKREDLFAEEIKLKEYLCVAYLAVFEALFVSGSGFSYEDDNLSLYDIIR